MNCLHCTTETNNPKFCSRSCAATYNNVKHPKRRVEALCKSCEEPCSRSKTYCKRCFDKIVESRFFSRLNTLTLADMQGRRKYQISSQIRTWARAIYRKSDKPKCCVICGYDKHYEVAHIKAIESFTPDTLVSEINAPENLIALCPNCHWEVDSGLLSVGQGQHAV